MLLLPVTRCIHIGLGTKVGGAPGEAAGVVLERGDLPGGALDDAHAVHGLQVVQRHHAPARRLQLLQPMQRPQLIGILDHWAMLTSLRGYEAFSRHLRRVRSTANKLTAALQERTVRVHRRTPLSVRVGCSHQSGDGMWTAV